MARTPVLAAGGIVLRREAPPRFAVVRLRKRNEWVLPKGKLDDGETARDAAEREVLEETGHAVEVHEFLGTLVYESGGRSKVVHYWRMDAGSRPVRELMSDVREVDWLPLDQALERLSRSYERVFLENVGPIALQAAAHAERERRARARALAIERRRSREAAPPIVEGLPAVLEPPITMEAPLAADAKATAEPPVNMEAAVADEPIVVETPALEASMAQTESAPSDAMPHDAAVSDARDGVETAPAIATGEPPSFAREIEPVRAVAQSAPHKNLIARVRDWLRRAA